MAGIQWQHSICRTCGIPKTPATLDEPHKICFFFFFLYSILHFKAQYCDEKKQTKKNNNHRKSFLELFICHQGSVLLSM